MRNLGWLSSAVKAHHAVANSHRFSKVAVITLRLRAVGKKQCDFFPEGSIRPFVSIAPSLTSYQPRSPIFAPYTRAGTVSMNLIPYSPEFQAIRYGGFGSHILRFASETVSEIAYAPYNLRELSNVGAALYVIIHLHRGPWPEKPSRFACHFSTTAYSSGACRRINAKASAKVKLIFGN
jgi:hypothetical protein